MEDNLVQLLFLRPEDCPSLKQWLEMKKYLSHDVLNELIGLMANHVLREILCEIRAAVPYSSILTMRIKDCLVRSCLPINQR